MSNITIDARMLNASGIGTYLRNLLPLIINKMSGVHFFILGHLTELKEHAWAAADNVGLIEVTSPIYSVREQLEMARKTPRETTLFWSPHYNIPLLYQGKLVVTIHDVFHLAMPQYVDGFHKKFYARGMFQAVRRKADATICVSNFTKMELLRYTSENEQNVRVIHNGVEDCWFQFDQERHLFRDKPYFLYVGNVKPHKNLGNLLKAYQCIVDKFPHNLVIVGKKEGFITGDDVIIREAEKFSGRVRFTGHITDNMLKDYYKHADALVFPSFYEGFGLPPLEAMASGCPVLVSNAASLPEVCGEAALYCDPAAPASIAEQMQRLLEDGNLRSCLQKKGRVHAKQFRWEHSAAKLTKVFEEVLST